MINFIRHGEKFYNDTNDTHLSIDGFHRAKYIERCVGAPVATLAFPNGHPTKLLAGSRTDNVTGADISVRPSETIQPLGNKLGLPIKADIDMADLVGFAQYVQQNLTAGETWFVSWQHWFIPLIAKQFDPNGLAEPHFPFPKHCNYTEWTEPDYIHGRCYDLMVQLVLVREIASRPWRIQAFTDMHMGFGGKASSPCASAFVPYSNPTGWKFATIAEVPPAPFRPPPPVVVEVHGNGINDKVGMVACTVLAFLLVLSIVTRKSAHTQRPAGNYDEHLLASVNANENEGQSKLTCRVPLHPLSSIGMVVIALLLLIFFLSFNVRDLSSHVGRALPLAFLFNFCAGGLVGALAETISAPLDRVKLLMQTQDTIPSIVSGEVPRYKGMIDCFVRVHREQGFHSFWRGNLPNVLRYFPIAAFNFAFKDAIEGCFPKYDQSTQFMQLLLVNLASGGLAGAGSITIVYPLDYARTRLAGDIGKDHDGEVAADVVGISQKQTDCESASKRQFKGLGDCLMKTIRAEGLFSLYKGYAVSVVGIFMYRAPFFGLFDTFNAFNPFSTNGVTTSWIVYLLGIATSFLVAQITSAIAGFVSYPWDTVRRRLQMEAGKCVEERKYKGAFHCAYTIMIEGGVSGFYKGFFTNLIRGASTAFMLVIFKEVTGMFGTE